MQSPLETIMEDSQELMEGTNYESKSKISKNRGSMGEDENKKMQADYYLRKMNKMEKDNYISQTKSQIKGELGTAIEMSQMSKWTNDNIAQMKT